MDSLVKCLDKKDFKCLCEDFDGNVLGLVKQKQFYSYEYIGNFERFKEELPNKETFYPWFKGLGTNLRRKRWKIITTCI